MKMKTLRQVFNEVEEAHASMMDFAIRINGFSHEDWYWDAFIEMLEEDKFDYDQEAWWNDSGNRIFLEECPEEYYFEIVQGEWENQEGGREFRETIKA